MTNPPVEDAVARTLKLAAESYKASLMAFCPWISTYPGNNVIAEANITFHVARAFCTVLVGAHAFLEREFRQGGANNRVSLKLDAYLTSPDFAVLFEAKVLVDSTTTPEVLDDVDRANADAASQQLALHTGKQPAETRGLIVAECWKPNLRHWWTTGANGGDKLSKSTDRRQSAINKGWTFDSIEIGRFEHGSRAPAAGTTCFWLYAVGPSYPPRPEGAA